jgi:hypothetical protein
LNSANNNSMVMDRDNDVKNVSKSPK